MPSSSPVFSTYVEWESKPRKWSKRWLELREQGLWLSKKDSVSTWSWTSYGLTEQLFSSSGKRWNISLLSGQLRRIHGHKDTQVPETLRLRREVNRQSQLFWECSGLCSCVLLLRKGWEKMAGERSSGPSEWSRYVLETRLDLDFLFYSPTSLTKNATRSR